MSQRHASWTGAASSLLSECFNRAKPFIDPSYQGMDQYVRFVSALLFVDCHSTSESALILVREGKVWDAELLTRAVLEGTMKYVYMLSGTPTDMKEKAYEYWELMPDFDAVKVSERAKHILKFVPTPGSVEWRPFRDLILNDDAIVAARHGMNRTQRSIMTQRWSFSGITKHFLQSDDKTLRLLVHLGHGYGMSSHLLHKDGDGVGMIWERGRRNPQRKEAAVLAHAARVIADMCAFAKLRLLRLLKVCAKPLVCIQEIEERYRWLEYELCNAHQHFSTVEYNEAD